MSAFTKGFSPWRRRKTFRKLSQAERDLLSAGTAVCCPINPKHGFDGVRGETPYSEYLYCNTCRLGHGLTGAIVKPEALAPEAGGWTPPAPDDPFWAKGEKSVTFEPKGKQEQPKGKQEQVQVITPQSPAVDLAKAIQQVLASSLNEGRVREIVAEALKAFVPQQQATPAGSVIVQTNEVSVTLPEGVFPHSQLESVLRRLSITDAAGQHQFRNFLLFGDAGTGKTTMAQHLALALGFELHQCVTISIVPDMPSSALMGRVLVKLTDGTETYIPSALVPIMIDGGVIFLDEADNADPQILLALNSLTANGFVRLPNGDQIVRHPRCFVGLGMNTNGDGTSRQYTRAQLDDAFKDRFVGASFEIGYCRALEQRLCPEAEIRNAVWALREKVRSLKLRRVVSTRMVAAVRSIVKGEGTTVQQAIRQATALWSEADRKSAGIA